MASPQLEDGYLKIANELYDALTLANLTKNQYKVALAVVRRTYGWRKKADVISNSQFAAMTDMQGTHAAAAVRELIAANVLMCHGKTGVGQVLGINKNYMEWNGVWKSADAPQRVTKSVTPKGRADNGEGVESADNRVTEPVTPAKSDAAGTIQGNEIRHAGVTKSVSGGDKICQGGVTVSVNTKDIIKNKERQVKDNSPLPPSSDGETVVVDDCVAPQAASECDATQGALFAEGHNPGEQQPVKTTAQIDAENIAGIFAYWQKTMDKPRAKLDGKRRKLIRKALEWGYKPRDLCRAIQGCSLTPHNQGKNERGERYVGIELILRSAGQIDRFMENASAPPVSLVGMSASEIAAMKNKGLGARLLEQLGPSKAEIAGMRLDAAAEDFAEQMAAKYGPHNDAADAGNVIDMGCVEEVARSAEEPAEAVADIVAAEVSGEPAELALSDEERAAARATEFAKMRQTLGYRPQQSNDAFGIP